MNLVGIKSRRDFIKFLGRSGLCLSSVSLLPSHASAAKELPFTPLTPSNKDQLLLAEGFNAQLLIKELDPLNDKLSFGSCNDYTTFIEMPNKPNEGLLWVNHESINPLFVSGYNAYTQSPKRQKSQMVKERKLVGGSIIHVQKNTSGQWEFIKDSAYNRRIDADTKIPFASPRPIQNRTQALGTLANCAGGQTPWKTILTCEENYQNYYRDSVLENGKRKVIEKSPRYDFGWWKHFPAPPEDYGWVVEINPFNGSAKKLTSLGRFCHESATVVGGVNDRCVVYSGDDKADQCLYKFVAEEPGSLEKGELFVANLELGQWISLDRNKHQILQTNFKDQTEIQTYTRNASELVGATKLDRPEDVEVDPLTGDVYVSLTGNSQRGNYHGSILKISHPHSDHHSPSFSSEVFLAGGDESGFSCPDNLAFDNKGNLWLCCDIHYKFIGQGPWKNFKSNGLYHIPTQGPHAGKVLQVASGPVGSELTGICFSPDYKSIFVSVQHPGQGSKSTDKLLSHWPKGSNEIPKSAVVTITGPALEKIMS